MFNDSWLTSCKIFDRSPYDILGIKHNDVSLNFCKHDLYKWRRFTIWCQMTIYCTLSHTVLPFCFKAQIVSTLPMIHIMQDDSVGLKTNHQFTVEQVSLFLNFREVMRMPNIDHGRYYFWAFQGKQDIACLGNAHHSKLWWIFSHLCFSYMSHLISDYNFSWTRISMLILMVSVLIYMNAWFGRYT